MVPVAQVPDTEKSFQESVDSWFVERGVPYFRPEYTGRSRFRHAAIFLIAMLAVEVTLAPTLAPSALWLIGAMVVVVYAVLLFPVVRRIWDGIGGTWLLAGVALGTVIAGEAEIAPWANAAILFAGLYAALALSNCQLWATDELQRGHRRELVLLTVVSVVVFAFEGSIFRMPVDQRLPALFVVGAIFLFARSMTSSTNQEAEWTAARDPGAAALVPSMPLLVAVLGVETAVWPDVGSDASLQAIPPLVATAIAVSISAVAFVRANRSLEPSLALRTDKLRQRVVDWQPPRRDTKLAVLLAVFFLFSYPLLVAFVYEVDVLGGSPSKLASALVVLAVNVLFLGVVVLMVAFGIDTFMDWVRRQMNAIIDGIAMALAHGVPLLLVFTVFFALTAETWEVAAEASIGKYLGLLGALAGLILAFALASSVLQLRRDATFDDWDAVKNAALRRGEDSEASLPPEEPFSKELALMRTTSDFPLNLRRLGRINALSVLGAYQAMVFLPVTVVATLLFFGLGEVAVSNETAAEWIYGDDATKKDEAKLEGLPFKEQPGPRVALFLGLFSTLYLAVHVQSNGEQRKQFFDATERGVRQLLAVKLIYDRVLGRSRAPDAGRFPDR